MRSFLKKIVWRNFPNYFLNKYFRDKKNYEVERIIVPAFLDKQKAAIDVGAHGGQYTSVLSVNSRLVFAFEPIPRLAEGLRTFCFPNVEIINAALSDSNGMLRLHIPQQDGKSLMPLASLEVPDRSEYESWEELDVPLCRLDNRVDTPVSFIKIDVEGHEISVLKGAERLLKAYRPTLLIEIGSTENRHWIDTYLQRLGYSGYYVRDFKICPLSTFLDCYNTEPTEAAATRIQSSLINNFIFIDASQSSREKLDSAASLLEEAQQSLKGA